MSAYSISVVPNAGGRGQVIAVSSGASAQAAVNNTAGPTSYLYFCDVATYMRVGENPVAVTTDTILPANTFLRIAPVPAGMRLAFLGAGSGNVNLSRES